MSVCLSVRLRPRRFLGKIDEQGGVMECGLLATQAAGPRATQVQFAVYKGNECYAVDGRNSTVYGVSRNCNLRPDERGANMGGIKEFALYTLEPRGVEARYVRLVRRSIDPRQSGDLHVVGVLALTSGWQPVRPVAVRCMLGDRQTLIPKTSEAGADPNTDAFLKKLQTVGADLGKSTTFLHIGPVQAILEKKKGGTKKKGTGRRV